MTSITDPRMISPPADGHVNWIVQTPFGWQRDSSSPQIRLATGGGIFWGETDAGLVATTRLARARGIRTLLKPHIWLTDQDGPDLADLLAGWQTHLERIERLHTRFDKPVLFTELGYRSATFAASKPWEWPRPGESSDTDLQLQAACYEAFFRTFWDKPWFAGVRAG